MKKLFGLIVAFLFVVNIAIPQVLCFTDSLDETVNFSRVPGTAVPFKTYTWGPFDLSNAYRFHNLPAQALSGDTLKVDAFFAGYYTVTGNDTFKVTWNAYATPYKVAPADHNFVWSDSTAKIRALIDAVNTTRKGVAMVSWKSTGGTAAADTMLYRWGWVTAALDSVDGTPSRIDDLQLYWDLCFPTAEAQPQ